MFEMVYLFIWLSEPQHRDIYILICDNCVKVQKVEYIYIVFI